MLCVDDSAQVRDALEISFKSRDSYVWQGSLPCADHLRATVEQINRIARASDPPRPSVGIVTLDIEMPGKDVFEAAADLLEHIPDVKVVFFSGHLDSTHCERARQAGASACVSKEDGLAGLLAAVDDSIREE